MFSASLGDSSGGVTKVSQITIGGKQELSHLSDSISNHEKIIELLRMSKSGLTIADISKLLKITRNTVAISLARLEGAKQIEIRKVGMAKIYSLKPEVQMKLEAE